MKPDPNTKGEWYCPTTTMLRPYIQEPIATAVFDDCPDNGATRERSDRYNVTLSANTINAIAAALEMAFYSSETQREHGEIAKGRFSDAMTEVSFYREQLPAASKWKLSCTPLAQMLENLGEASRETFLEGSPDSAIPSNITQGPWEK